MHRNEIPKAYLYRQLVQAKLYIEANYSKNINLDKISKEACFSKFHFLRLFKESFGLTPNQFLVEVRLNEAKKLLKQGYAVQDTCWNVGFESISSFSLSFKKKFGVSPINFIQQHKKQHERRKLNPFAFVPGCFAENFSQKK